MIAGLISPQVPLKGKLSLWAKGVNPDYADEPFAIYLSTAGKDVADFTTVLIPETVAQGVLTEYTADLSAYAGQVGYIAIRHFDVTDMYKLSVDNITITDDWVEADGVTSPYTLDGLDDLSSYEVEVQAVTGEQQSSWSTLRFNTSGFTSPTNVAARGITPTTATISWSGDADSYNLRYKKSKVALSEGFESCSEGHLPAGWTTIDADGDGQTWYTWDPASSGLDTYDINYRLIVLDRVCATSASWIKNIGALTPDNWLISPRVILNGKLSLWVRGEDPEYAAEHFAIYLSTTGKDVADFTTELVTESEAQGVFTEYTADLSAYAGQVGYIAIRHFNTTDMFRLDVDNMTITDTSADEGDWVEVNNVTPSYALKGLDELSRYEVQLQAVYADGVSRWTSGIFVNTLPFKKYDLTLADGSEDHGTVAFTVGGNAATQAKKDDVVTVSVTPDEGYSAKDVTVRAYTTWAAGARSFHAPNLVDDIAVTKQEDGTWQFAMPEASVWVTVTYAKNLQDAWIEAIAEQTYTGEAITPTVTVQDGSAVLTLNTDYTVAYSNNTNAGEATVTITAVEGSDYSGTATATFAIQKADITMTTAPAAVSGLVYSGEAQTLITAGASSFGTVLYSLDGTNFSDALPQGTDAGTYTVTYKVEGDDNHNAFAAQTLNVTIATNKTELNDAITEAEAYYNTISETNPDAAAALQTAINTAKGVQGNADATQTEIETAAQTLNEAVDAAKADVALKRITLTIPAKSYMARIDADKRQIETAVAGVKLFSVNNVSNTEVVLTQELSVIAAEMPYFIYNDNDTEVEVSIVFEGETTGISTAKTDADTKDTAVYDLQGRRVMQPAKGLFIVRSAEGRLQSKNELGHSPRS